MWRWVNVHKYIYMPGRGQRQFRCLLDFGGFVPYTSLRELVVVGLLGRDWKASRVQLENCAGEYIRFGRRSIGLRAGGFGRASSVLCCFFGDIIQFAGFARGAKHDYLKINPILLFPSWEVVSFPKEIPTLRKPWQYIPDPQPCCL